MSCSLFLAKFMSHLSQNYKIMCHNEGYNPTEFNAPIYNNALTSCLFYYSQEDSQNHGRLRELQKMLFRFDDRIIPMTREEEVQFYLNDVKIFKEIKKFTLLAVGQTFVCIIPLNQYEFSFKKLFICNVSGNIAY